ncbi:hypothetical protein GGI22_005605, partial [Coemansia erecta]
MSSSKRVQASLSSFFKPKQQKQQATAASSISVSANSNSLPQSSTTDYTPSPVHTRSPASDLRLENPTKRRRGVLGDEEFGSGDNDDDDGDDGYMEDRVDSASPKQRLEAPEKSKRDLAFPKRRNTGQ